MEHMNELNIVKLNAYSQKHMLRYEGKAFFTHLDQQNTTTILKSSTHMKISVSQQTTPIQHEASYAPTVLFIDLTYQKTVCNSIWNYCQWNDRNTPNSRHLLNTFF